MHNGSTIIDLDNLVAVTMANSDSLKVNVEREVWKRILFGKGWTLDTRSQDFCNEDTRHYMCTFDATQPYDIYRMVVSHGVWHVWYVNGDRVEVPAHAIKHATGLC